MTEPTSDGFETIPLPADPTVQAPDGCAVRVLIRSDTASTAHFELAAGQISTAVEHPEIEEIWHFVRGRGEMWRKRGASEEVVRVEPGVTISIPPRTRFQLRALGGEPLAAFGVTMPPWPLDSTAEKEAFTLVDGKWKATVP